jgi:hypothetical protein
MGLISDEPSPLHISRSSKGLTLRAPARGSPVTFGQETMPIKIALTADRTKEIAWLCGDEWALPAQVAALEKWLKRKRTLKPADYYADLGFMARRDAGGGGSVLTPAMMQKMVDLGITLYLSEYPGFAKEKKPNKSAQTRSLAQPV